MWVALPIAGIVWVGTFYRHTWYYYDEWSMIDRSMGGWGGLLDGHQGHLAVENYLVYRAQRAWFGLQGHRLVFLGHFASLAAFQVTLALLLRKLGLPSLLALLSATVLTYFGPGSQNMLWEFQQNINFALAVCFLAAFVALREQKTQRAALVIAGLLALAVACDSGLAVLGAAYVGILVVALWPRRLAVFALVPPLLANLAWFAFGDQGVNIGASLSKMWTFAWRLFALSAAGLVGGGERPSDVGGHPTTGTIPVSGVVVGLIVLALAGAGMAYGYKRHLLSRTVVASAVGGVAAAVLGVALLAKSRAFLVAPEQFSGSRYVQWIAVFLLMAIAPVIAAIVRPATVHSSRRIGATFAIGLIVVFVVNLGPLRPNQRFFAAWSDGARAEISQAVTVVNKGCPPGRHLEPSAEPSPNFDPQVSVRLLRELIADGALPAKFGVPASKVIRDRICKPDQRS